MRLRAAAVVALAVPMLLLAGCGNDTASNGSPSASGSGGADSSATDSAATDASGSDGASSSEAPPPGPEVPAASSVAAPVDKAQMPTVSDAKFGEKPTLTFPKGNPPNSLQRQVLTEGTGAVVKAKDWLIAHYEGQVWNGKVFDNSYDRKKPSAFQIGVGRVVSGWDVSLVGMKVGSRVLLSLPPADGYQSAGKAPDIKGTDTIVFVVDIVDAVPPTRGGQTDVKAVALPKTVPTVTGELGQQPKVVVPKGMAEPKKAQVDKISTGTGAKVKENDALLVQYEAVTWDNQPGGSTWKVDEAAQAQGAEVGLQQVQVQTGSPFASLVGVPVGSRVLLTIPATAADQSTGAQAQPAIAVVIDVVVVT